MSQSQNMQGKRVLVTGSDTGIGRGVGLKFAACGADVAFHYCHHRDAADAAAAEARKGGVKANAFAADFRKHEEVGRLADQAGAFLGGVDVLINNAGITMNKPLGQMTSEHFDTLISVNLKAMFFMTQHVTPGMIEQGGGAVVNLASVHAFCAMTEHSVYAATKAAIVAMTRVLATELAPQGVRVNAIAPGHIVVENHFKAMGNFDMDAAGENIPAGRLGRPNDIAELAMFLVSDAAEFIVGQTYVIDGGQMSIMPYTGDFRQPRGVQFGQGYVEGV